MNYIKGLVLILFAFSLSILDTTFFAGLSIANASIISSFLISIIFALQGDSGSFYIFVISSIIFFSIFSSVPILFLIASFFILPGLILFLRRNYLPEPSVALSALFFLAGTFLFELILMIEAEEWTLESFRALYYFIILNSVSGIVIFYISKKIRRKFSTEGYKIH